LLKTSKGEANIIKGQLRGRVCFCRSLLDVANGYRLI